MSMQLRHYVSFPALALALLACNDPSGGEGEDAETSDSTADSTEAGSESESESESDTTQPTPDMGTGDDPNLEIPPPDADGCHAIYAQDHFPEFEIVVQEVVWEQLEYNWDNGEALEDDPNEDPKKYLPLDVFRYQHPGYEQIEIYDAAIRLRGNEINWDPLPGDKMQFQIGFHHNDKENGNFLGIKRLLLDSATFNRTMMRDRLALQMLRDVGVRAPCANNARLMVDVEYLDPQMEAEFGEPFFYGVFTNIEKLDEVFLQRTYEDPSGDLWKRASWELKTNLDTANNARLSALRDATTLAGVEQYLDIEQSLLVFATEAAMPDSDGMWAGGLNFYLYDDPTTGKFHMLPWDLDNTFDRFDDPPDGAYPINPDPIVFEKANTWGRPWFDIPMADPVWFDYYIGLMRDVVDLGYQADVLHERITAYDNQIRESVYEDTFKPYENSIYDSKVEQLHDHVQSRADNLEEWLACWEGGGTADPDGYCVP